MPRCIELTPSGRQCSRDSQEEDGRCHQHHQLYLVKLQQAGPEIEERCNIFLKRAGRWARCGRNPVHGHTTCRLHTNVQERRAELRRVADERIRMRNEEQQRLVNHWSNIYRQRVQNEGQTLHQVLEDITNAAERGEIPWHSRFVIIQSLADLIPDVDIHTARENLRILAMQIIIRRHQGRHLAPRQPITLQEIAADRQNVHRRDVSEQTNKGTEVLLAQTIPENPRTCQLILGAWVIYGFGEDQIRTLLRVYDDMNNWYRKATCRHSNDFLYKRMLDGLWVLITNCKSDSGNHYQLTRRLFEECTEATGLCCEGHLTRLVNVMVGFDDAFRPPVSWKDVIGDKVALISKTDVPLTEKITAATQVMDELNVPSEERTVWIDALE
jgi:hypothetical protein